MSRKTAYYLEFMLLQKTANYRCQLKASTTKKTYIFSKRFGHFIPTSPPSQKMKGLAVYFSYFVPQHNVINLEQNGVSNGCHTCFDDVAFRLKCFSSDWQFTHGASSPHYPGSRCQVQLCIHTFSKVEKDNNDPNIVFLQYISTPVEENGKSSAQLLLNKSLLSKVSTT